MCMKNLNATILTCVEAKRNPLNANLLSYNDVFDIITPQEVAGKAYVSNFDVVIDMTAVFGDKDDNAQGDMHIKRDSDYSCMFAVTFDGKTYQGLSEFVFSTRSLKNSGTKEFCHSTFLINEQSFVLPENASECDLVLLMKYPPNDSQGRWVLQTIKRLFINGIA